VKDGWVLTPRVQNGGYINPPRIKRQFRDPYATWWDPQERRNFGEPVHEDNDVLGIFSPWEYTWTTTGPGLIMVGTFIAVFLGVSSVVYMNYPDKPSYPREFEGGLERELGGPGAVRVGGLLFTPARRTVHADPFCRREWPETRTLDRRTAFVHKLDAEYSNTQQSVLRAMVQPDEQVRSRAADEAMMCLVYYLPMLAISSVLTFLTDLTLVTDFAL